MGTGNSQKITLRHQGNLTACANGREEVFRRCRLPWIFTGSVHPWVATLTLHYTVLVKTAPSCTRGWAGELPHAPKVSSPASCRGGIRTWAGSTAPGSFPSPASPTPALSSHPGKLLLAAAPGEAAAVCKLLSPCLCLPGPGEGFTLPLSLCSDGAKSKSGHLEGKNLFNVT